MLNKLKFTIKNKGCLYLIKKYMPGAGFRPMLPTYLQLETTSRCNMNCRNCTRDTLSKIGDLSLDNFFHIINQFPFLKEVKLQGLGEPLLNNSLFDMASFLTNRKVTTYIATNGTLITEDIAAKLVRHFDKIEISIDSSDKNLLRDIRGRDCLDDVLRGARLLKAANGASDLAINFVLERANVNELTSMVKLADSLQIKHVNAVTIQNWVSVNSRHKNRRDEISERGVADNSTLNRQLKDGIKLAKKLNIFLDFSTPDNNKGKCFWYKRGTYVSWNGYVTPCCIRPNYEEFNFGNILREDFKGIWNGPEYAAFRRNLASGKAPVVCKGCSYLK